MLYDWILNYTWFVFSVWNDSFIQQPIGVRCSPTRCSLLGTWRVQLNWYVENDAHRSYAIHRILHSSEKMAPNCQLANFNFIGNFLVFFPTFIANFIYLSHTHTHPILTLCCVFCVSIFSDLASHTKVTIDDFSFHLIVLDCFGIAKRFQFELAQQLRARARIVKERQHRWQPVCRKVNRATQFWQVAEK